ncbi:MAG: SDR family NAD(P)-dependent oxidoreductase [Oscillospiraceae bacterium]|jgi:NAD(P)-dependent dehydrogenase (short-subunit alcohol dehydrogenase family)|nr:SDR family NAD(P)-dependent oxidoreductase [Oscillospiraceae bacterium]
MARKLENLKGKTAFITGGASGIGLGVAKACAAEGMNVVIADLRQGAIDEALPEINAPKLGIKLDTSNREQYKKAADEAEAKFGKIHVLVNNAGIACAAGPLWSVSADDTDFALRVNIVGILNGIQEILPRMLAHGEGGYVVSTASKAGIIPVPGCGLYNLTKQAVVGISETLASDLPDGYGAAVLCPGPFSTNLGRSDAEIDKELRGKEPQTFAPPPAPEPKDGEAAPPPPPPPPAEEQIDFSRIMRTKEEAGLRVVRAIKRGDIYILTHAEFKPGWKQRSDAILRAFPDDEPYDGFAKVFGVLVNNPAFERQTQVPAFDGTTNI